MDKVVYCPAAGGASGRVASKGKKKQAKDDIDRQKQAEKKKRRLEKALANSAAIISELEKKKQKKREEQQRLDEEGAAIAEAVALHVLVGEEDTKTEADEESSHRMAAYWNYYSGLNFREPVRTQGMISPVGYGCSFPWGYDQGRQWDFCLGYSAADTLTLSSLRIREDMGRVAPSCCNPHNGCCINILRKI